MQQTPIPILMLFVKIPARAARVGDIVKSPWGLREVLGMEVCEGDAWFVFRDNRYVTGEQDLMEVLVP